MTMVAKPIIPQTRIRFIGEKRPRILPSVGEVVAIPLTHDWGPMGAELTKPEVIVSFEEWSEKYGDGDTEGRTAVAGAFAGQNLAGAGGAGGVIPYRMGDAAVKATVTLDNTGAVDAVKFTARYRGTRGNDLSVQIDADPANAANDRCRIRFQSVLIATVTYPKTELAKLVAGVNVRNLMLTAEVLADGTALATTVGTSLAGGTNGSAITGADHLLAMDGLEYQPFSLLAPANLTDANVQASYLSWVRAQEVANRPVMLVVGGLAAESLDTAVARSVALADPHVVNFGIGTYHDDLLDKDLSSAQLAPRIAGVLAAKGESKALTGAELGGLHIVGTTGVTTTDAEVALQLGVTVLIRTDSPDADLRVAKGVTTFTSETDAARPRQIFEEPRFIRIMDLFIRRLRLWGDRNIIGNVPVNQDTRDAVRAEGSSMIDRLVRDGLVLTKADGADLDPFIYTPVTTDDTLPFEFGWQFAYTANFLLGEGRVR